MARRFPAPRRIECGCFRFSHGRRPDKEIEPLEIEPFGEHSWSVGTPLEDTPPNSDALKSENE